MKNESSSTGFCPLSQNIHMHNPHPTRISKLILTGWPHLAIIIKGLHNSVSRSSSLVKPVQICPAAQLWEVLRLTGLAVRLWISALLNGTHRIDEASYIDEHMSIIQAPHRPNRSMLVVIRLNIVLNSWTLSKECWWNTQEYNTSFQKTLWSRNKYPSAAEAGKEIKKC